MFGTLYKLYPLTCDHSGYKYSYTAIYTVCNFAQVQCSDNSWTAASPHESSELSPPRRSGTLARAINVPSFSELTYALA